MTDKLITRDFLNYEVHSSVDIQFQSLTHWMMLQVVRPNSASWKNK